MPKSQLSSGQPLAGKLHVLFAPATPSHATTHRLIADELHRRRHTAEFVVRDPVVGEMYRVRHTLDESTYRVREYAGDYRCDLHYDFADARCYRKVKRAVYAFLNGIRFDAAVMCNDSSSLFDRLLTKYGKEHGCQTLLVQESVRPSLRRVPLLNRVRQYGLRRVVAQQVNVAGSRLLRSPFFKPGYGRSGCTMVAAAGDRFRRQLIEHGVPDDGIRVTGQPRLDFAATPGAGPRARGPEEDRVLVFCNQPLEINPRFSRELVCDLVCACDKLEDVRLLVKLHPRDRPEAWWREAIPPEAGKHLLDLTRTRPLAECFEMADAVATVASTTSLEAMSAGLPVGLIKGRPINNFPEFSTL